jgi:arsenical pump membrane protein
VLFRPFRVNEAWWACGGAVLLVLVGALSPRQAGGALARGIDVYLFLSGMMALAEFARAEGVFDWLAARTVRAAGGSRAKLLALVYGAGIVTTAFLSNDATIVVLTPAVLAALVQAGIADDGVLPYVFACALVANAASTLLPIANPSNLLFFADGMPPLGAWLGSFALASVAAVVLTYGALALVFRRDLRAPFAVGDDSPPRPRVLAFAVLGVSALALVLTASRSGPLGTVTFALGVVAALLAATRERSAPLAIARGIAWPVVALTAGLFVLVEGLDVAGAASFPRALFAWAAHQAEPLAQLGIAFTAAAASNAVNNLPVGLELGKYVGSAHPPAALNAAALMGVNVGPNFSANGSLATVLWLAILRRANVAVSPLKFAAVGLATTPLALIAAALLAR